MRASVLLSFFMMFLLLPWSAAAAGQTEVLKGVRAPSKGPDNAPVTIIEIADFM